MGIEGPRWLTDPRWAKPALMAMGVWLGGGGGSMILYLAALQGVPAGLDWLAMRYIGSGPEAIPIGRLVGLDSYFALIVPGMFSAYGTSRVLRIR